MNLSPLLVRSSIWQEEDHVRILWITMLSLSDDDGIVESSVTGLAKMASISVDRCRDGLEKLSSPDRYSRTKDRDGRRICEADGGWRIVNYRKYNASTSGPTEAQGTDAVESEAYSVADLLASAIFDHDPEHKDRASYQVGARARWAQSLIQLHRDGVSWESMRKAIAWYQADTFWLGAISDGVSFCRNFSKMRAKAIAQRKAIESSPAAIAERSARKDIAESAKQLEEIDKARDLATEPPEEFRRLVARIARKDIAP